MIKYSSNGMVGGTSFILPIILYHPPPRLRQLLQLLTGAKYTLYQPTVNSRVVPPPFSFHEKRGIGFANIYYFFYVIYYLFFKSYKRRKKKEKIIKNKY